MSRTHGLALFRTLVTYLRFIRNYMHLAFLHEQLDIFNSCIEQWRQSVVLSNITITFSWVGLLRFNLKI